MPRRFYDSTPPSAPFSVTLDPVSRLQENKKGDLSSPNKIFCWAVAILFPEKATAPAMSAAAPDTGKRAFLSLTASSEIAILNLSPLPLRADRGGGRDLLARIHKPVSRQTRRKRKRADCSALLPVFPIISFSDALRRSSLRPIRPKTTDIPVTSPCS